MNNTRKLWIGLATLLGRLVRGPADRRRRDTPPGAADAGTGRRLSGACHLHPRRHRARPPGLAVDRRHATGLDLGSRRLCGAGLDRRLVAPRGSCAVATSGPGANAGATLRRIARGATSAALAGRLRNERFAANTYDPVTGIVTLDEDRVAAISNVAAHYESLFGNDPATARAARSLRDEERHGAGRRTTVAR